MDGQDEQDEEETMNDERGIQSFSVHHSAFRVHRLSFILSIHVSNSKGA
jgi:hypothetical protein